jgi:CPA2 family monovalent cation:H+ antiporter-2
MVLVVLIIVVAKPVIAAVIAMVLHQSRETALTIGAGLAQIGEFSFILGTLGRVVGLLPDDAYQLIITGAIVSIAVNPLAFRAAKMMERNWRPAGRRGLATADLAIAGGPSLVPGRPSDLASLSAPDRRAS